MVISSWPNLPIFERQRAIFDIGKKNVRHYAWSNFARTQSFCIIGIVNGFNATAGLEHMVNFLHSVPRSVVLALSHERPTRSLLENNRRRLYWLPFQSSDEEHVLRSGGQAANGRQTYVKKFCPKFGRPKSDALVPAGICDSNSCKGNRLFSCPSPLRNQQVKAGAALSLPGTLLPFMYNKPMAGYGIRTHQDLGRIFNFEPKFIFYQKGIFNPTTNLTTTSSTELASQLLSTGHIEKNQAYLHYFRFWPGRLICKPLL